MNSVVALVGHPFIILGCKGPLFEGRGVVFLVAFLPPGLLGKTTLGGPESPLSKDGVSVTFIASAAVEALNPGGNKADMLTIPALETGAGL